MPTLRDAVRRTAPQGEGSRVVSPTNGSGRGASVALSELEKKFERVNAVVNDEGQRMALTRNGELLIMAGKDRILETYSVPNGSMLMVEGGQQVQPGQVLQLDIGPSTGARVEIQF